MFQGDKDKRIAAVKLLMMRRKRALADLIKQLKQYGTDRTTDNNNGFPYTNVYLTLRTLSSKGGGAIR